MQKLNGWVNAKIKEMNKKIIKILINKWMERIKKLIKNRNHIYEIINGIK